MDILFSKLKNVESSNQKTMFKTLEYHFYKFHFVCLEIHHFLIYGDKCDISQFIHNLIDNYVRFINDKEMFVL
jgi:hypothetical protein